METTAVMETSVGSIMKIKHSIKNGKLAKTSIKKNRKFAETMLEEDAGLVEIAAFFM